MVDLDNLDKYHQRYIQEYLKINKKISFFQSKNNLKDILMYSLTGFGITKKDIKL